MVTGLLHGLITFWLKGGCVTGVFSRSTTFCAIGFGGVPVAESSTLGEVKPKPHVYPTIPGECATPGNSKVLEAGPFSWLVTPTIPSFRLVGAALKLVRYPVSVKL